MNLSKDRYEYIKILKIFYKITYIILHFRYNIYTFKLISIKIIIVLIPISYHCVSLSISELLLVYDLIITKLDQSKLRFKTIGQIKLLP